MMYLWAKQCERREYNDDDGGGGCDDDDEDDGVLLLSIKEKLFSSYNCLKLISILYVKIRVVLYKEFAKLFIN